MQSKNFGIQLQRDKKVVLFLVEINCQVSDMNKEVTKNIFKIMEKDSKHGFQRTLKITFYV